MTDELSLPHKKPIEHLYVSVDTCAELGGQPYKVLEALHDVYAVTQRRTLTVVDTAQGLLEKTEFITPEMLSVFPHTTRKFSNFVQRNEDWVQIVETNNCAHFRETLETIIFPEMVDRLVAVADDAVELIQKETWAILQQRGITHVMGQEITCHQDIPVCVQQHGSDPAEKNKVFEGRIHHDYSLVFVPQEVNEAAKLVFPQWKQWMQDDPSMSRTAKRDLKKNDMALLIRAIHEAKACTHTILTVLEPECAEQMGVMPDAVQQHYDTHGTIRLDYLRQHAHHYGTMEFPDAQSLGELNSTVQAVRLTALWPWARKQMLHEGAAGRLDAAHHNAADHSYLNLFTAHLPEMSPPKDTLYVLLSHDMPLRRQFLEVTTGVSEQYHGKKSKHPPSYQKSGIYNQPYVQQRPHEDYPHEAVLVGSEFVELMYKEAIASLAPYISQEERKSLLKKTYENHPQNSTHVGQALLRTMDASSTIPESLHDVLTTLTKEIIALEAYVMRDIQAYGEVDKHGHYHKQKHMRVEQGRRI